MTADILPFVQPKPPAPLPGKHFLIAAYALQAAHHYLEAHNDIDLTKRILAEVLRTASDDNPSMACFTEDTFRLIMKAL